MLDRYGIPNLVRPGTPREFLGQNRTEYNDLKIQMLANPQILAGVYHHLYQETGMLSELLMHIRRANNVKRTGSSINWMESEDVQILDNYEFAWRIASPRGWLYRIVEAPTLDVNGNVGAGGLEFTFTVDKKLGDMDDVLMLADGNTQIKITRNPEDVPNGYRITCRLLIDEGGTTQAIPGYLLEKHRELGRKYNQKAEASTHGSKSRIAFGDYARGWMTTMRWEWNATGHVAHTKLRDEDLKWLVYTNDSGQVFPYWISVMDYNMMKDAIMQTDDMLFWGRRDITADGKFRKDARGYDYITGDGLYNQSNRRMKREYRKLSFDVIDDILKGMYIDNGGLEPTIWTCGGVNFRKEFDKLIRNEFKLTPTVLFYDGKDNFYGVTEKESADKSLQGLKTNFTYYETPVGKFIVSKCPYFDSKSHPTLLTSDTGEQEQSFRAIFVNTTPGEKEQLKGVAEPITITSIAGRRNVIGEYRGMSNPAADGTISTTADIQGKHMLTTMGIALHNPNCIGELKLARRRN